MEVSNWKGSITYQAHSVEKVASIEEIVEIVRDPDRYPSPVRVKGSHHSTTRCVVAEGGTVIDVSAMNRILRIDAEHRTITMQAGVLHADAAVALQAVGLQFHVNIELGNMTVGSGACGGTKDASYISDGVLEYGQVASYCVGMRVVRADGTIAEITESQPEELVALRSSYGMLGVICEVTYRVKPLRALAVEHRSYSVEEFAAGLDEILGEDRSVMMYLFPFLDRLAVEFRSDGTGSARTGSWQWRLRNWVWKTGSPTIGRLLSTLVPSVGLRAWLLDRYNWLSHCVIVRVLKGRSTSPADQIIRYPERGGFAAYTFSIWAFPRETFPQTIRDYFEFCKTHFRDHGYRCDLLNVGYSIAADRQSLFSYTRRGHALTLDPVSTGGEGWDEFLGAYNRFCAEHDGAPLLNQTPQLTAAQVRSVFSEEITTFQSLRRRLDPADRFYTPFFAELFSDES